MSNGSPATRKAPQRRDDHDRFLVAKAEAVRRLAETKGLIRKGGKNRMVTARIGEELLAEAKRRSGITSDSELIETALASLAVGDDFGEWLLAQRGRLPKDFTIDL